MSANQLREAGYAWPEPLKRYTGGLILQDSNGDGLLNPARDTVIGGFTLAAPQGAAGQQVLTPLVSEKPFLSVHTERFNERAGATIGGAIMQVVFIAGNRPGLYRIGFAMLGTPGQPDTARDPDFHYTVVVE